MSTLILRRTLGTLLLASATLKSRSPVGALSAIAENLSAAHASWILLAIISLEWLLGLWLWWGGRLRVLWAVTVLFFTVALVFSLNSVFKGAESCGCFGDFTVRPSITAGFDGLVLVLLFLARGNRWLVDDSSCPEPPRKRTSDRKMGRTVAFGCVGLSILAGMLSTVWSSLSVTAVSDSHETDDVGRIFVLSPEDWLGDELPVLEFIEDGQPLQHGDWVLLFHRKGCQRCAEEVTDFCAMASMFAAEDDPRKFALVEVPNADGQDSGPSYVEPNAAVRLLCLSPETEWVVSTPFVVCSKDRNVTAVSPTTAEALWQ